MHRPVVRAIALAFLTLPALAGAAQAHAVLMASEPAADGSVAAGRTDITLRYNSRIDAARSRVTLTAPGGTTTLDTRSSPLHDGLLTQATLSPGAYVLHWQVLATDGHITRGDVPFTVHGP